MRNTRKRNRRGLIPILFGICVLVILLIGGMSLGRAYKNPAGLITVSTETTYITDPLDEHGFVDYLEAINQRHSAGVTPEDNFEVVVRSVYGTASIDPGIRAEYYRRLGIDDGFVEGTQFAPFSDFLESQALPAGDADTGREDPWISLERPWTAEEYPTVHEWVVANSPFLDLVVEGSYRPSDYTPYVAPEGQRYPLLIGSFIDRRDLARALMARCMFRIGLNDAEGAWNDLQALRRIARHTANGASVTEFSVGLALDAMAHARMLDLMQHGKFDAEQLARFASDLETPKPMQPAFEKVGERLLFLDTATHYLRSASLEDDRFARTSLAHVALLDWNAVLRNVNTYYDELAEAARTKDRSERTHRIITLHTRLKAQTESRGPFGKWSSDAVASGLFRRFVPGLPTQIDLADQAAVRTDLMRLAIALERHRVDHGGYPATLEPLVPRYTERIPSDPFSGVPPVYTRDEDGYVLYSVGPNGIDQGGAEVNDEKQPEADDMPVRITRTPSEVFNHDP